MFAQLSPSKDKGAVGTNRVLAGVWEKKKGIVLLEKLLEIDVEVVISLFCYDW